MRDCIAAQGSVPGSLLHPTPIRAEATPYLPAQKMPPMGQGSRRAHLAGQPLAGTSSFPLPPTHRESEAPNLRWCPHVLAIVKNAIRKRGCRYLLP